jgi:serine-type D-Ala-D-Ala carboxypeptidase/endopeptidase (penicillin-binding protein 4)
MRRAILICTLVGLVAAPAAPAAAGWKGRIDRIVRSRSMGIAVRIDGRALYEHGGRNKRVPASNEKLLLSMALFDHLEPTTRLITRAGVRSLSNGTVPGNLFVLGTGDPTIAGTGSFASGLPFRPTRIRSLAARIKEAGVERIRGSVVGSTHYFTHDWFAPGWRSYFPQRYVPLASALTYNGNAHRGTHIPDPELRAARALTKRLESIGVRVREGPRAGKPRPGLDHIAQVHSQPLRTLVRYMNRKSSNFFAEVLGKRLGVARYGQPGSIAKAGAAIEAWANTQGVGVEAHDGSGLSYENRVSPIGLVRLLGVAENRPWGDALRGSLPKGGQGTLEERLIGTPVRAKTGTLTNVSALSGWVWAKRLDRWVKFSILSRGMDKSRAVSLEDRIVKILNQRAR